MTKSEFKKLKLPVFVQVRWIDGPDSVHLLVDRDLNTVSEHHKRFGFEGIDDIDQIVRVIGKPLKFPKPVKCA